MRDLFCGNADRPGALPVEEGFLLRETPEPMRAAVEKEKEALEAVQHRYRLPKALSILKSAALMVGLIMAASILRADVSLAEAYRNAPWVEWIGGGSLLAAGVLFLIEKLKQRRAGGSAVVQAAFSGLNRAEAAIREYHSIPADAEWVEILAPSACGEDEDPDVPLTAGNREHRLFVRDGALCLFDGERLYAFPRKELTGIRLVEREIGSQEGTDRYPARGTGDRAGKVEQRRGGFRKAVSALRRDPGREGADKAFLLLRAGRRPKRRDLQPALSRL